MDGRIRVVVADDNDEMLKVVSDLLRERFHVEGMAGNGPDLIRVVQEFSPDVVVADIDMPIYSGLEVMSNLRSLGVDIPFVMLSNNPKDAAPAMTNGATAYVHKFDIFADLTEAVLLASRGDRFISRSAVYDPPQR